MHMLRLLLLPPHSLHTRVLTWAPARSYGLCSLGNSTNERTTFQCVPRSADALEQEFEAVREEDQVARLHSLLRPHLLRRTKVGGRVELAASGYLQGLIVILSAGTCLLPCT